MAELEIESIRAEEKAWAFSEKIIAVIEPSPLFTIHDLVTSTDLFAITTHQ